MSRSNFSKATKRERLKMSGGHCEAVGAFYGLPEGKRCMAPLSYGVEFDHLILQANSRDSSLENCRAVCIRCHRYKTPKDTTTAAKTVRQQDKHNCIEGPKKKIQSRGFQTYQPRVKDINDDMKDFDT